MLLGHIASGQSLGCPGLSVPSSSRIRVCHGPYPPCSRTASLDNCRKYCRDIPRARSVYERALQVNYRHLAFWLKYAEMEMRHRFVNHARNIFDRCASACEI